MYLKSLPKGYELSALANKWNRFTTVINHTKYANNYDFNKAVFLVNKENFYDAGHLLLKEDMGLSSPVSVVYLEYYDSQTFLRQQTGLLKEKIQCVVGRHYVPFGKAQSPHPWDYADGIDIIEFLLKKHSRNIVI